MDAPSPRADAAAQGGPSSDATGPMSFAQAGTALAGGSGSGGNAAGPSAPSTSSTTISAAPPAQDAQQPADEEPPLAVDPRSPPSRDLMERASPMRAAAAAAADARAARARAAALEQLEPQGASTSTSSAAALAEPVQAEEQDAPPDDTRSRDSSVTQPEEDLPRAAAQAAEAPAAAPAPAASPAPGAQVAPAPPMERDLSKASTAGAASTLAPASGPASALASPAVFDLSREDDEADAPFGASQRSIIAIDSGSSSDGGGGVAHDDEDDDEIEAGPLLNTRPAARALPSLVRDYACPICFEAPRNAVTTPCGHVLCGACLFQVAKTDAEKAAADARARRAAFLPGAFGFGGLGGVLLGGAGAGQNFADLLMARMRGPGAAPQAAPAGGAAPAAGAGAGAPPPPAEPVSVRMQRALGTAGLEPLPHVSFERMADLVQGRAATANDNEAAWLAAAQGLRVADALALPPAAAQQQQQGQGQGQTQYHNLRALLDIFRAQFGGAPVGTPRAPNAPANAAANAAATGAGAGTGSGDESGASDTAAPAAEPAATQAPVPLPGAAGGAGPAAAGGAAPAGGGADAPRAVGASRRIAAEDLDPMVHNCPVCRTPITGGFFGGLRKRAVQGLRFKHGRPADANELLYGKEYAERMMRFTSNGSGSTASAALGSAKLAPHASASGKGKGKKRQLTSAEQDEQRAARRAKLSAHSSARRGAPGRGMSTSASASSIGTGMGVGVAVGADTTAAADSSIEYVGAHATAGMSAEDAIVLD